MSLQFESIRNGKNIISSSRFQPASFRLNVHDDTYNWGTRHRQFTKFNITAVVIKTFVTAILACINSSAKQSQWAAIFSQKATTTVCHGLCHHPYSMPVPYISFWKYGDDDESWLLNGEGCGVNGEGWGVRVMGKGWGIRLGTKGEAWGNRDWDDR